MARAAPAPRLPAVAHVRGAPGQEQVVHRAEERVASRRAPAPPFSTRGEIDQLGRDVRAVSSSSSRATSRARPRRSTRKRATPPSGKMLRRRWRDRRRGARREQVLRVGPQRRLRAAARVQRARCERSASGVPRGAQAVDRGERRVVAEEVLRCRRRSRARSPGAPERERRTSRGPASRLRRLSQPSIHLPRSVYLPAMNTRAARAASRFSMLGEEVVAGARARAPPSSAAARSTEAGEGRGGGCRGSCGCSRCRSGAARRRRPGAPRRRRHAAPRSQRARARARTASRPTYGVTLWRRNSCSASTVKLGVRVPDARGRRRSPGAMRALAAPRGRRARAGPRAHPARELRERWRRAARASVQTAGSPSCSDAMPPQAASKSPRSGSLSAGVHGLWSVIDEVDRRPRAAPARAPRGSRARGSAART